MEANGLKRLCRVVWKREKELGVAFERRFGTSWELALQPCGFGHWAATRVDCSVSCRAPGASTRPSGCSRPG